MSEIHAHIETESRDCDGRMSKGYIMRLNDVERASEFGDIDFHNRVVGSVVNSYSLMDKGTLTVQVLADGDKRLSWSEQTEEGFTSTEATICTDPCADSESWQRDHTAEAAGY